MQPQIPRQGLVQGRRDGGHQAELAQTQVLAHAVQGHGQIGQEPFPPSLATSPQIGLHQGADLLQQGDGFLKLQGLQPPRQGLQGIEIHIGIVGIQPPTAQMAQIQALRIAPRQITEPESQTPTPAARGIGCQLDRQAEFAKTQAGQGGGLLAGRRRLGADPQALVKARQPRRRVQAQIDPCQLEVDRRRQAGVRVQFQGKVAPRQIQPGGIPPGIAGNPEGGRTIDPEAPGTRPGLRGASLKREGTKLKLLAIGIRQGVIQTGKGEPEPQGAIGRLPDLELAAGGEAGFRPQPPLDQGQDLGRPVGQGR